MIEDDAIAADVDEDPRVIFHKFCLKMLHVRALLEIRHDAGVLDFHTGLFTHNNKPLIIFGPIDEFNEAPVYDAMIGVPNEWMHVLYRGSDA